VLRIPHCFFVENEVYLMLTNEMIAQNVENIRRRIAATCRSTGRSAEEVTLVAVSKTVDTGFIREAMGAGCCDFGENYIQELREKHQQLLDEPVRWHYIGHLQTNKIKYIIDWVQMIHAVDSLHLGKELSHGAEKVNRTIDVLVEVNTSGESTKFGVSPDSAIAFVKQLRTIPRLNVKGLMTMGPFLPDPEDSRPAFRTLRELRTALQNDGVDMPVLSMGMTNDFEVAIEEGATIVRIGTAIFGSRTP
jgi:PLP dependent protein